MKLQPIHEEAVFSRPRVLSSTSYRQIIVFASQIPRSGDRGPATLDCVLKFFASKARISYERERTTYNQLLSERINLCYPRPHGYAEWPPAKYRKAVGRGRATLLEDDPDSTIYVLLLQYIRNAQRLSACDVQANAHWLIKV